MTYAMSDIHGKYQKYLKMLELIDFKDEDTLFVLGDMVDRGEQPIELLKDMMLRPNVYPLLGNHDLLALDVLRRICVEITAENYASQLDRTTLYELMEWMANGGQVTLDAFKALSGEERLDIIGYIADFSLYEAINVGDRHFILVHAGLGNFRPDKKLSEYTPDELLLYRGDYDTRHFEDESIYIVSGHTPTLYISGKPEIYKSCGNICIDCGAFIEGGRLACLRLDDLEEFYV